MCAREVTNLIYKESYQEIKGKYYKMVKSIIIGYKKNSLTKHQNNIT